MTITERLERMERRLRRTERHNRVLMAVLLLAAVVLTVGAVAKNEKVVEAGALRVVDPNGRTRAELGLLEEKWPALRLYDANGKMRFSVAVKENGPDLGLYDDGAWERVRIRETKDGPRLHLSDEKHQVRAALLVSKDRTEFGLLGENGMSHAMLDVRKQAVEFDLKDGKGALATLDVSEAEAQLELGDRSHAKVAFLRVWKDMSLFGMRDDKHMASLEVSKDGPMFGLYRERKKRAGLNVSEQATRFYLYDPNGNTIWQAPPKQSEQE